MSATAVWVSDEYGPYVYHYADNGALLHVIRPPAAFIPMRRDTSGNLVENFSANSPPTGQSYNTGNPVSGRQNDQGFEGLAISPDRKTLFVLLQSALIQDLDPTSSATINSHAITPGCSPTISAVTNRNWWANMSCSCRCFRTGPRPSQPC